MIKGYRYGYNWIETVNFSISNMLEKIPDIVLNKYIAITSFDSGPISPSNKEMKSGWKLRDEILYTSKITNIETLPHNEFDEWYIFDQKKIIKTQNTYINYMEFSLQNPKVKFNKLDSRKDKNIINDFWSDININKPNSFILEGDKFIFGSNNNNLFKTVETLIIEKENIN